MNQNFKQAVKRIGKRIQQEREAKEMSQAELAWAAKVSITTLQKIERGESNFLITTLARIAWALKKRPSIFIEGEE